MTRREPHRGFYGIVIDNGKNHLNLGTLWRTTYNMGAAFTGQIGGRYERQSSDTVKTYCQLPHFIYRDPDEWFSMIPYNCVPVAVEISDDAIPLPEYKHPNQAVYILGPEDGSVRAQVLENCRDIISIPTNRCLNQAVAGGMVMYDRLAKCEIS